MLSPEENDNAWHGGCLALAELGIYLLYIFYVMSKEITEHVYFALYKWAKKDI